MSPDPARRPTPLGTPASLPPYAPGWAFFLDIDGTLLELAEKPDAVRAQADDRRVLERLREAAGGAVALISGRSLAGIDEIVAPLTLPAAGQHGFERRDGAGRRHRHRFPAERLRPAAQALREFAARHEGLVFEDKGASIALHYRQAPELADRAHDKVRSVAHALAGAVEVQRGKMVWELKPVGADKGLAIEEFMREPPFADRTPVFLGDDVTDEHGFVVVNNARGHSIKVGDGPSAARWRIADPTAVRAFLAGWIENAAG